MKASVAYCFLTLFLFALAFSPPDSSLDGPATAVACGLDTARPPSPTRAVPLGAAAATPPGPASAIAPGWACEMLGSAGVSSVDEAEKCN